MARGRDALRSAWPDAEVSVGASGASAGRSRLSELLGAYAALSGLSRAETVTALLETQMMREAGYQGDGHVDTPELERVACAILERWVAAAGPAGKGEGDD